VRLILHLGTHKTGTTAVQRFLATNRSALAQQGVHYAAYGANPDANLVANAVATGHPDAARDFFSQQLETARRADAQTVLVSAENFYGMAVVAAALEGRSPDGAVSQEPLLVRRLQSVLPPEVSSTQIVGYFRRPDRFAESLYNQRVKYETFAETFERYLQLVAPMFAYHRNASAWAEVFGAENCSFKVYESVTGDIRTAFLRDVLEVTDTRPFVEEAARDNERVSRDVLEFKREINRTTPDSERQIEYRIACQLEEKLNLLAAEPKHYQEFMSPRVRADFLDVLAADTAAFQASFALPPFPPLEADAGWEPYPGLSEERQAELRREYERISAEPDVRRERRALRSRSRLRRTRAGRALLAGLRRSKLHSVRRVHERA
jgi:hypothetical protein